MSADQNQREMLEQLKKENAELRRQLNSRDIPFNHQLLDKAGRDFYLLSRRVGEAISNSVSRDLIYSLKGKRFYLDYHNNSYGSSDHGYLISFVDKKDEESFINLMAELEMKKFKESLENFSWVLQNQGQG